MAKQACLKRDDYKKSSARQGHSQTHLMKIYGGFAKLLTPGRGNAAADGTSGFEAHMHTPSPPHSPSSALRQQASSQ